MIVKENEKGELIIEPTNAEHERIVRLADIYGMVYFEVLQSMFSFADHMATTRILNQV